MSVYDENKFVIQNGVLIKYSGNERTVTVPDNVTEIGTKAFYMNSTAEEVILPNSVKKIAEEGFLCCYNLTKIILPSQLTCLGKSAFSNCRDLQSIIIPERIIEIPNGCFFACGNLETAIIPSGLKRVGKEAFSMCALKEILIPEGVEIIDTSAFSRCWKLSKVMLPKSVKKIEAYAFAGCKYLPTSTLTIHKKAYIVQSAFDGCCITGYRTVKYRIHLNSAEFNFVNEEEIEVKDNDSLLDTIDWDCIYDELQDTIDDAIHSYDIGACGIFDVYRLIDQIIESGKEYVRKYATSTLVIVDELDSHGNILNTSELHLAKLLEDRIEMLCQDEGGICLAGGYVEKSLFEFVKRSQWQFALVNDGEYLTDLTKWPVPINYNNQCVWMLDEVEFEPVMWFGIPNQAPIDIWKAKVASDENESVLFSEDAWDVLSTIIGEYDDYFMTWYFSECGNCVPDIDEIKNACPIRWDDNDSEESLKSKISDYMTEMMK